jgi:hypothetical protein
VIRLDASFLLMIELAGAPSREPVIDSLTRAMAGALNFAKEGSSRYRGIHQCTGRGCVASSDNTDHYVSASTGEFMTNSLAVHYLAHHRAEVPANEIDKVASLLADPAEPTASQLAGYRGSR